MDADPDRVAQVLRNLARNAVAHTSTDGHVEILASADGDRIRFEVIDDGPGIDPDEAAHLFERFYRSPEARARDRDGSGLGLAIALAIVDAHGGESGPTPITKAARDWRETCRATDPSGCAELIDGQWLQKRLVIEALERDVRHRDYPPPPIWPRAHDRAVAPPPPRCWIQVSPRSLSRCGRSEPRPRSYRLPGVAMRRISAALSRRGCGARQAHRRRDGRR